LIADSLVLVVWQTSHQGSTGVTTARFKSGHGLAVSLSHCDLTTTTHPARVFPFSFAGSELIYCLLSLTAKLYLGIFLLINVRASTTQYVSPCWSHSTFCTSQVIMVDGGVENALAGATQ